MHARRAHARARQCHFEMHLRLPLPASALLLSTLLSSVTALSLRDFPIATSSPVSYLDSSTWRATEASLGLSIAATVPGDIISDLQRAGVIGDPYYERTWIENRTLWDVTARAWTFTSPPLQLPAATANATRLLVLDGVKMGARISFGGAALGNVTNQFLRYIFELPAGSGGGGSSSSSVEIVFDNSLPLHGRFMPCSGEWDWAPSSQLSRNDSEFGAAATFSSGIWQSAYVATVAPSSVALLHVVPLLRYLGAYPVGALREGAHAGFAVNVTLHVWAPAGGARGSFALAGSWPGAAAATPMLDSPPGESRVSLQLAAPASAIALWWPNGLGGQPLYNRTASWTAAGAAAPAVVAAPRRLGFRVAALVTINDTNASAVAESAAAEGSGSFGMFLRVNGAALLARGADLVPMEQLEGRLSAAAYAALVDSAADARMNALRLWGGGIYPPQAFYDACDARGLLLYHDLMFSGGMGHGIESAAQPLSAAAAASIRGELAHQVRRLAHHASIILYDGANEVIVERSGPTELYASLVMAAVAAEDGSRALLPASPSSGWLGGVNRLWGTASGQPLVASAQGYCHIWSCGSERHGPYTAGVGAGNWTTVMRDPWTQQHIVDPAMPLAGLAPAAPAGVGQPALFVSEAGATSMSSFEAMSATLAPRSWSLHGGDLPANCTPTAGNAFLSVCTGPNALAQRNWACDNLIWGYFGARWLNASASARAFQAQLFQCQIASALTLQQNIEGRRAANQAGLLLWQLNEIWATGGWGSLEYSSGAGALAGGRWKPAHYWLRSHLFADVMAGCGTVGRGRQLACFVSNAAAQGFSGTLALRALDLRGGGVRDWLAPLRVEVPPGPLALAWPPLPAQAALPNASTTLLLATVLDGGGAAVSQSLVHLAPPASLLVAADANVSAAVAAAPNADGSVDVALEADELALFVTLTCAAPGRFSDNALLMLRGEQRTLQWLPFATAGSDAGANRALLAATLRVEHHAMYLHE